MKDVLLSLPGIALTIVCWGAYGTVLHKGQHDLEGSRLKPLICVGLAYFVVAIIVPIALLAAQGKLWDGWTFSGISWSMAAGAAGAFGAMGIVLALTSGGRPVYVMPLVFGGAPIVNVFVAMYFSKIPWSKVNHLFTAGMVMVVIGAVMVLVFQPKAPPKPATETAGEQAEQPPAPTDEADDAASPEKEA